MVFSSRPLNVILLVGSLAVAGCQGLAPPVETPVILAGPPVVVESIPPGYAASPTTPVPPQAHAPSAPDSLIFPPPPAFVSTSPTGEGAIAPQLGLPAAEVVAPGLPNPLKVPVSNHDFAWDQIVDVVSDYFPIASEERVHIEQQIWTEGYVKTPYQVAATMFEPNRKDSVGAFNRWQSTLQTVRRRAVVRVVPEPDGYLVDLRVDRELEDLPQPEQATAGAASLINDNAVPSSGRTGVSRTEWSPVWIPLGRDTPLEQKMLAEIRERLAVTPHVPMTITPVQ